MAAERHRLGRAAGPARLPGGPLAAAGQQPVGDARAAPAVRALQGDGVGRRGPRGPGRGAPRAWPARWTAGAGCATRSTHEVCQHGFDADRNTFTQSYGSHGAGRGAAADPAGRVPAVGRPAGAWAPSRRYRRSCATTASCCGTEPEHDGVDGLPGGEGAFLACSVLARRRAARDRARGPRPTELFERLLGLRNDVGLLSEEYDPGERPAARQHPAGVQPGRPDQHRSAAQRAFHPDVITPARAAAALVLALCRRAWTQCRPSALSRASTPHPPDVTSQRPPRRPPSVDLMSRIGPLACINSTPAGRD